MAEKVVIGNAELWHGDCREVLPLLPRHDLLLTDPPYGIGRDRGFGLGGTGKNGAPRKQVKRYSSEWDDARPDEAVFCSLLTSSAIHIIWGGQFFADVLPPQGKWLWWDKQQTMPSYGDGEMAWTSLQGSAVKKFVLGVNGLIACGETGKHPTQKPVRLMAWCLDFAAAAQTVLDPFMGSGTTGVACAQLGKAFTGIERERKYFDIACERISRAQAQGTLLPPQPAAAMVQEGLL